MIVCQCSAVSDTAVDAAVRAGAETLEEIGALTGAGTGCGGCHERLHHMVQRAAAAATESDCPAA